MSQDQTTDAPSDDERIVAAPHDANPGTEDGVGEHVLEGMGHDALRRMDGEFADLEAARPTVDTTAPGQGAEPSTQED
jgi:hypothetical protein